MVPRRRACARPRATASSSTARRVLARARRAATSSARAVVRRGRHPHRGGLGGHRRRRRGRGARRRSPPRAPSWRRPARRWPPGGSRRRADHRPLARERGRARRTPARRRAAHDLGPAARGGRPVPARRSSTRARGPPGRARSPRGTPLDRAAARPRALPAPAPARPAAGRLGREAVGPSATARPARSSRARYARRPRPLGLRDAATTSRPSTTPRSPRWTAAGTRRALEVGCSIGVLHRAARRPRATTCWPSTSPRARSRPRAGARAPAHVAIERREIPEQFPAGPLRPDRLLGGPLLPRPRRRWTPRWTAIAARWRPRPPARRPLAPPDHRPAARRRGPRSACASASGLAACTEDHARLPARPASTHEARPAVVIAGGGPAALAAARGYRDAGGDGDSRRSSTPEARTARTTARRCPRTSCAARSSRGRAADRARAWYAEHGVTLRPHRPRQWRSTAGGAVRAATAASTSATTPACSPRARARRGCPCRSAEPALTLRSLADAQRAARGGRAGDAATVVGSGFIGCEAAASLAMRGLEVTLVSDEERPQPTPGAGAASDGG